MSTRAHNQTHTLNPLFRTSSKPYTKIILILKMGVCLCDLNYTSHIENLQQTLNKNSFDFENGVFVCVIHIINPLLRTSSKPYTQIHLILKTGICLCDSDYKYPFQNLQQTLYKNSLDFENGDLFV